mgnify:CR=1 FL=1
MYDFLTFITGTHVLDDGTSFLLENFLEHQMSSEILTPLRVVVPQYLEQTNGTKAFEIGSNVLNLVFDDESVMGDSEIWFGIIYSLNDAGGFA